MMLPTCMKVLKACPEIVLVLLGICKAGNIHLHRVRCGEALILKHQMLLRLHLHRVRCSGALILKHRVLLRLHLHRVQNRFHLHRVQF